MGLTSSFETYGLRNIYKGQFISYVDENYIENNNYKAYIGIPDIILNTPNKEVMKETVLTNNIKNKDELNLETTIDVIDSIICRPLFINKVNPSLENGDNVLVFIFDNDPKKIYYADIDIENDSNDEESNDKRFLIRIGRNTIYLDKDEIRLSRDMDSDNDNSIIVSQYGIEITGNRIVINDVDITDRIKS